MWKENNLFKVVLVLNHQIPCLKILREQIAADPSLANRGVRRYTCCELSEGQETPQEITWKADSPALLTAEFQLTLFNQKSPQDRHHHLTSYEIFIVMSGEMNIEVREEIHSVKGGEILVVMPGEKHLVRREGEFQTVVVTVPGGDKVK